MSPMLLEALVVLAAKHGPEFVANITAALKKKEITVDEVHNLFANVKPYEAYGIPNATVVKTPAA